MAISERPIKREFTKEELDGPKGPTGYPMIIKVENSAQGHKKTTSRVNRPISLPQS